MDPDPDPHLNMDPDPGTNWMQIKFWSKVYQGALNVYSTQITY
jgi:hypothetical protein